jgi:hypothetical protein
MRKSASEVIRNLENRIARLEKQSGISIVGGVGVNLGSPRAETEKKTWSSAKEFFKDVDNLLNDSFYRYIEQIEIGQDYDTGIKDALMFVARSTSDGHDVSDDPYIIVSKSSLLNRLIEEGTSSSIRG